MPSSGPRGRTKGFSTRLDSIAPARPERPSGGSMEERPQALHAKDPKLPVTLKRQRGAASRFSTPRVEGDGGLMWTSACEPCAAGDSGHGCFLSICRWGFSTCNVESDGNLMWTSGWECCLTDVWGRGEILSMHACPATAAPGPRPGCGPHEPRIGQARTVIRVFHTAGGKRWEFGVDKQLRAMRGKRLRRRSIFVHAARAKPQTRTPRTRRGVR